MQSIALRERGLVEFNPLRILMESRWRSNYGSMHSPTIRTKCADSTGGLNEHSIEITREKDRKHTESPIGNSRRRSRGLARSFPSTEVERYNRCCCSGSRFC